jgi:hypothetical protein
MRFLRFRGTANQSQGRQKKKIIEKRKDETNGNA